MCGRASRRVQRHRQRGRPTRGRGLSLCGANLADGLTRLVSIRKRPILRLRQLKFECSPSGEGGAPMPFSNYRDNFEPETLLVLEAAFNEAWEVLRTSGGEFDQELTRKALAELIMSFAAEGETDPKRLKVMALKALPYALGTQ
jgi:hypothetical protein